MHNNYKEISPELIERLKNGVFLTTSDGDRKNTMAIGWATIGRVWNKPVLMVAVRYSRYTYNLLNDSKEFTVSIPKKDTMVDEMKFCGSKSGRDFDKFSECNLKTEEALSVKVPILSDCQYHIECKVIYQQAMEPETLTDDTCQEFYKNNNDYHVLFYGEILNSYEK